MAKLWRTPLRLAAVGMVAGLTAFAQYGQNYGQNRIAQPGAVNYIEGNVTVNGQAVTNSSVGSALVNPGEVLQTTQGKAEMLLTPGVFARLDDNSALRMVSSSLVNTEVELQRGRAMVEVDMVSKENRLLVLVNGFTTQLEKNGIYQFDANNPSVAVYDGKAVVQANDKTVELSKGQELALNANAKLKAHKFDRNANSELYAWSKLRSQYMAQANASSAQVIYAYNPWWWYGTGWYWNPWFSSWAFVPGGGYFYGPFGYGFFSPAVVYARGGFYSGFHGYGYAGGFRGGAAMGFGGGGGHFGGFGGRR
jgi:hypothetical protein